MLDTYFGDFEEDAGVVPIASTGGYSFGLVGGSAYTGAAGGLSGGVADGRSGSVAHGAAASADHKPVGDTVGLSAMLS